jgi:hypothetical protein
LYSFSQLSGGWEEKELFPLMKSTMLFLFAVKKMLPYNDLKKSLSPRRGLVFSIKRKDIYG